MKNIISHNVPMLTLCQHMELFLVKPSFRLATGNRVPTDYVVTELHNDCNITLLCRKSILSFAVVVVAQKAVVVVAQKAFVIKK